MREKIPLLHRAFTLIEMLIVVTIIGILSAAIIPRMTGYMERTRDLKRKLDLQQIATAMQLYYDQHGTWPQKNKEYQEKMRKKHSWRTGYNHMWSVSQISDALSPYLSSIPKDPNPNSHHQTMHRYCHNRTNGYANYSSDPLCLKRDPKFIDTLEDGEYFFWSLPTNQKEIHDHMMLFAKVEAVENANRVWWAWSHELPEFDEVWERKKNRRGIWNYRFGRCTTTVKTDTTLPLKWGHWVCSVDGNTDSPPNTYYVIDLPGPINEFYTDKTYEQKVRI